MAGVSGTRAIAQSHIELEEKIRQRAYEIYRQRGGPDLDNWLEAEREVLGKSRQPAQDRGTTVGDARRPGRNLRQNLRSS